MALDDKISVGEALQLLAALQDYQEVVSELTLTPKLLSVHHQARVLLKKIKSGRHAKEGIQW